MSTTALVLSFAAPAPFPGAGARTRRAERRAARHEQRRLVRHALPGVHRVRPVRRARPGRAPHGPLRLTRRGRLLVTCTAVTALTGAVVAVTGAYTGAAAGAEQAPAPVVLTVAPGQTLSSLAAQWAPGEDWRDVAGEIVDLNGLPSMALQAGQRLTMPDRPHRS
ncbi:LysM peptidoglycan-binding domain-containing protein [Kineococcus sp. TBRC 1896]|uniref:LysM peptidoglycan-binding domain-containing protein n=1 Tax=Kineococcus mangrovi TaxID=1660183 RepID=A0ABV4I8L1_9ACTN